MTRGTRSSEVELVAWMMGLQLAFGLVLALLASWQLRPFFAARMRKAERGRCEAFFSLARVECVVPGLPKAVVACLESPCPNQLRALAGGSGVVPSLAIVPCSGKSSIPAARAGLPGSLDSY